MSTEATYEIDQISLIQDSRISSALDFVFSVLYRNLKEEDHRLKEI